MIPTPYICYGYSEIVRFLDSLENLNRSDVDGFLQELAYSYSATSGIAKLPFNYCGGYIPLVDTLRGHLTKNPDGDVIILLSL